MKTVLHILVLVIGLVAAAVSFWLGFLLCFALTPCTKDMTYAFYKFFLIIPFGAIAIPTAVLFFLKSRVAYAGVLLLIVLVTLFAYLSSGYGIF